MVEQESREEKDGRSWDLVGRFFTSYEAASRERAQHVQVGREAKVLRRADDRFQVKSRKVLK